MQAARNGFPRVTVLYGASGNGSGTLAAQCGLQYPDPHRNMFLETLSPRSPRGRYKAERGAQPEPPSFRAGSRQSFWPPLREVLGRGIPHETHNLSCDDGTGELNLITHDAHKLARLLTRNGYSVSWFKRTP